MRLVLTQFVLLTLSACSMFQRDRPSVKTTDTSPKSATLSTGMSGFEVERLIGKPNRVTTEACKLGNKTSECLIWRYTERRQATIWFHGSDPLVVLFDLENVR